MSQRSVIAGIDIGSTKVAAVVGQQQENGGLDILGVGFAPNTGLRKGTVVDIEDTVSAVAAALEEVERMSGLPITRAAVSIGGTHMQVTTSRGIVAIGREGEINDNDILRVLDAARSTAVPTNREILHAVPRQYMVDGQDGVKDPVGMSGIRLEVDTLMVSGTTAPVKNLTKCLSQAGVQIDDLVFTPFASAKAVLTRRQQEIGVCMVDIGGGTTSYAVYEEGALVTAGVLPIGSSHITNDIAIGLRTTIDVAEAIKVHHGNARPAKIDPDKVIQLKSLDRNEEGEANLHYVAEIIEARTNEILLMIRDELRKIGRDGNLPAGVVFTGGGAKLAGLPELAKETLRLPAQTSKITHDVSGMVDNVGDPLYAASIGLMLWGLEATNGAKPARRTLSPNLGGSWQKVTQFFRQLLP
jgi:cell division protein FtsA